MFLKSEVLMIDCPGISLCLILSDVLIMQWCRIERATKWLGKRPKLRLVHFKANKMKL